MLIFRTHVIDCTALRDTMYGSSITIDCVQHPVPAPPTAASGAVLFGLGAVLLPATVPSAATNYGGKGKKEPWRVVEFRRVTRKTERGLYKLRRALLLAPP